MADALLAGEGVSREGALPAGGLVLKSLSFATVPPPIPPFSIHLTVSSGAGEREEAPMVDFFGQ